MCNLAQQTRKKIKIRSTQYIFLYRLVTNHHVDLNFCDNHVSIEIITADPSLKHDQPLDEPNPTPISTELSLEHYRASLQQSNNENLAKCVSQFESFNHKIKRA